jgi:hypothetical protein
MKIKIVQEGYESFTGNLGDIQFAGGFSVTNVDADTAAGIAAIYEVELVGADAPVIESTGE